MQLAEFGSFCHHIYMWNKLPGRRSKAGMLYVIAIMATVTSFGFVMMGGTFPKSPDANPALPLDNPPEQKIIFEQTDDPGKENLQLQTFSIEQSCESKIAVNFLIDVSGSMRFGAKLNEEKDALRAFTNRMVDESVIGMQVFSDRTNVREVVPINFYKNVETQVQSTISTLIPDGTTSTKDGMILARDKLSQAISSGSFPDYKFSLVLLTDGVPETNPIDTDCIARAVRDDGYPRCFARSQDPRVPTNIGNEIKALGVDIYSINITSSEGSDVALKPQMVELLKDIASDPDENYYQESFEGAGLTGILDRVFSDICNKQEE